jgi:hypothetical protein
MLHLWLLLLSQMFLVRARRKLPNQTRRSDVVAKKRQERRQLLEFYKQQSNSKMPEPQMPDPNRQGVRMFLGQVPMFMGNVLPMWQAMGRLLAFQQISIPKVYPTC